MRRLATCLLLIAALAVWTQRNALRSAKFWSVAAPIALALTAQVGFLVHQIAILEPVLGRALDPEHDRRQQHHRHCRHRAEDGV